jgi:large subunit ribosomal protein L4
LVVLDAAERAAALSFRNLPRVAVLTHDAAAVTDIVAAASLLLSQTALDALTARASRVVRSAVKETA